MTPIKVELTFEFDNCCGTTIELYNRDQFLAVVDQSVNSCVHCAVQVVFPGQLHMKISNLSGQSGSCTLSAVCIGGLNIPSNKLATLCYTVDETGTGVWMPQAYTDATITLDFFAKDWIQYHLLIGNKIEL